MSHTIRIFILSLSIILGLTGPATATNLIAVEPAMAVDQSELIFLGQVVHMENAASGDGLYPFTFVTFEVQEIFKGQIEGEEITLRFDGGDLPLRGERVEVLGMPTFELGDESLLFVSGNGKFGCPVFGWQQGRLDLVSHPATGETLLMDHSGAPVETLTPSLWKTGEIRYDADEQRWLDAEPEFTVLAQDGVVITPTRKPTKARTYLGVQAELVFEQLRTMIQKRRLQKSFLTGRLVESASVYDLPHSMQFTNALGPVQQ